jgi:hypothetical protein
MRMRPNEEKIDETSLTREEAEEFANFLLDEFERHMIEIHKYTRISNSMDVSPFMHVVAQTVIRRHWEDIKDTQKTLDYLSQVYGL